MNPANQPGHTFCGFDIEDLDEVLVHAEPSLAMLSGGSLFVTGGTGFIGQWLLAALAHANATRKLGLSITVLTRSIASFDARCPQLASDPAVRCEEGDVRVFEFPKGRFTHVIHAATETTVAADRQALKLIDTIVNGTRRVLEFSLAAGAERVLLVSSGAIYGPQPADTPALAEDHVGACPTTDRRSVYGQAKRLAEQLGTLFYADHGLPIVIGRLFAFVGPGLPLDAHFAIGNFIGDAVAGRKIVVTGDGTPIRSYLYAGDLVAWLLRLLVAGRPGSAYNVGSDQAYSIADVAARVARVIPSARGYAVKGAPQEGGFRFRYVPAIALARAELGLDVWTSLDESIRRTGRCAATRCLETAVPVSIHRDEVSTTVGKRVIVIDIDGVIASLTPNNDYTLARPLSGTIAQINRIYEAGHRIVLSTARGAMTGLDWSEVTRKQLEQWGVKYHEIRFGKPAADFYIDDRMLSVVELSSLLDMQTDAQSND
jgi:dTDP-glucose 4,6-dehydratase